MEIQREKFILIIFSEKNRKKQPRKIIHEAGIKHETFSFLSFAIPVKIMQIPARITTTGQNRLRPASTKLEVTTIKKAPDTQE